MSQIRLKGVYMLKRGFLRGLIHMYMYDQETSFKMRFAPDLAKGSKDMIWTSDLKWKDGRTDHYTM